MVYRDCRGPKATWDCQDLLVLQELWAPKVRQGCLDSWESRGSLAFRGEMAFPVKMERRGCPGKWVSQGCRGQQGPRGSRGTVAYQERLESACQG